jgi:hypothetical protein
MQTKTLKGVIDIMEYQEKIASNRDDPSFDREAIASDTAKLAERASERGKQQIDAGKKATADQAQKLAGAGETIARDLRNSDFPSLADYTGELAENIRQLAEQLRHRSIDELLADTQTLAQRNPTMFLLGSVTAGVALSRFFKASGQG